MVITCITEPAGENHSSETVQGDVTRHQVRHSDVPHLHRKRELMTSSDAVFVILFRSTFTYLHIYADSRYAPNKSEH